MIELVPVGDRELWRAAAKDDAWSLPLYIDWRWHQAGNVHYALVMPAVGLYTNQHLLLKSLLDPHDIQGRQDQWLIPKRIAEAILHKAPGITPLAYYKWDDPRCPALPSANTLTLSPKGPAIRTAQGSNDYEAFVKHLCKERGLPNSVVRVVLRAVAETAAEWMIEARKPLDLGFCRLLAVPFRPNWKEIVAFKFRRWHLLKIFNGPQRDKLSALEEARVPQALCSLHNLGIHRHWRGYRIDYTLEAIPGKAFEKAINKVEEHRLACGTTSYVASFEKTVETLYPHILAALETYLRKIGAPFARVCERGAAGILRFLPTKSQSIKVRGMELRHLPVRIVAPDSCFSVKGEQDDENLVRETDAALPPPMSAVSPGENDVWGRFKQRQLAESGDGGTGTNGVPLSDEFEGDESGG